MNARQLTITATEVPVVKAALATGEPPWLVREGVRWGTEHLEANAPPVEFVQACAPCPEPMCRGGVVLYPEWEGNAQPCPDCRIELVGPCHGDPWCYGCERGHVLGYAYPAGQPLVITDEWNAAATEGVLMRRHWLGTRLIHRSSNGTILAHLTAALAHYGPPESLVGKWAMCIEVKKERT